MPGLLQTAAYMTGILTEVRQERGVEAGDIAEAVAERIGRQGYLLQRDRQFVFVIEEPALRFRPYGTAVQRDQLQHLPGMMMLPSVSSGVIPIDTARRGHRPRESFDITDSDLVTIELLSPASCPSPTRTRSAPMSPPGSIYSRLPGTGSRIWISRWPGTSTR